MSRLLSAVREHAADGLGEEGEATTGRRSRKRKRKRKRGAHSSFFLQKPRARGALAEPAGELPEALHREVAWGEHGGVVLAELRRRWARRQGALAAAREGGQLAECGCCCDDEVLPAEGGFCGGDDSGGGCHFFCLECVRRAASEVIGRGGSINSSATAAAAAAGGVAGSAQQQQQQPQGLQPLPPVEEDFRCLASDTRCPACFPEAVLRRALPARVWDGIVQRRQTAELRRAGLQDLVECPFCHFAVIMPNPHDTVMRCLNAKCLKASCRLCLKAAHIPLRCDEVETDQQLIARKQVEEAMATALTITCRKCSKRFFKDEGCNHMTCPCGAHYCYQCGAELDPKNPYKHFDKQEGRTCSQNFDTAKFNAKKVNAAGRAALAKVSKGAAARDGAAIVHNPLAAAAAATSSGGGRGRGRARGLRRGRRRGGRGRARAGRRRRGLGRTFN
jgi:TRIAD3 protein (E3 ubiquitin-protein ligase RNF216)